MKRLLLVAPIIALTAACTSLEPAIATAPADSYTLVDPTKVNAEQYAKDYAECAGIANQNDVAVKEKVTGVARTAANKASFGVVGSAKSSEVERGSILRKCLTGRGYTVLR